MNRQVMPKINGEFYRCECGCNVFTEIDFKKFKCNSCEATYSVEYTDSKKAQESYSDYYATYWLGAHI